MCSLLHHPQENHQPIFCHKYFFRKEQAVTTLMIGFVEAAIMQLALSFCTTTFFHYPANRSLFVQV